MRTSTAMNDSKDYDVTKIIGQAKCPLDVCINILDGDYSTAYKKEAMSSIGRKRQKENKPILFQYAKHDNPEVAMQAIRGLLVFKKDDDVITFMGEMASHPNDMIKDIIQKELEFSSSQPDKHHATSPDYMKNVVVKGDTLDILKHVPDRAVHLTFTSPPYYNARDYSIYANYSEYLSFLTSVFNEVYRITKEGRFLVLNTSPIIIPRAGRKYSSRRYPLPFDIHSKLMDIGWEFIDDIIWVKPEKSAKNRISNFNTHRKPLTYKPNPCTEYIMVYRKKSHKLIDWNLKQYDEDTLTDSLVDDKFERSNMWEIAPTSSKVHSAVFPIELCKQVTKLYSFKNDLVFDPFAGSGTFGVSAIEMNRYCFLTEICDQYVDEIVNRIDKYLFLWHHRFRRLELDEFKKFAE